MIKFVINNNIDLYDQNTIIDNFFYLTNVRNYGAAWSILTGSRIMLIIVTILIMIGLYYFFIRKEKLKKYEKVIYGFLYGGIIGNLIDRIFRGYVIDYLEFYIFSYNFPVFNLADILIVISMFFIIISVIKGDKNEIVSRRK
jgi:signal peptidase II